MNCSEEDEEGMPIASSWLLPVEPEVEIQESEKYLELAEEQRFLALKMKESFYKNLEELLSSKGGPTGRNFIIEEPRYETFITEVKEAQEKRRNGQPLAAKDYHRINRFDVLNIGGKEMLIQKTAEMKDTKFFCRIHQMFDTVHLAHLRVGHKKEKAMEAELKKKFCNITREVIKIYLDLCETCILKKKLKSKALVEKPIIMTALNSRCQVDLIDMQSEPDGEYKFILSYQDHQTMFVVLRPLKTKTLDEVSEVLLDIFSLFGAPYILHSDNGREFCYLMEEFINDSEGEHCAQAVRELESELVDKMCEICGNFFKTFELVNPEAKKPLLTTCETCSYYITPSVASIYSSSHPNEFSCDECSKVFGRKDKLLRHKATHSESKHFFCDMCDKSYKRQDTLNEHIKLAHLKDDKCAKDKCVNCRTVHNIITINVGENEAEFIKLCEACNLSRQERMAKLNQNGSKEFTCDLCSRSFSRKDHATRHRLSHLNVKPFKCSICKKSFSRNDRLTRHMKSHPGAKPFSCKVCSKTFADREQLKIHLSTHPIPNEKFDGAKKLKRNGPSVCEVCGKTFKLQAALLSHQKAHSDANLFKCDSCGLKYKTKETLKRHMLVHSSTETYSCHVCKKVFMRKDKLKAHHLVHIDIKPYTCDFCNSAFKWKDKLDRHLRHVHRKI